MRLPARKWSEYLKEMGHRFPINVDEYHTMQSAIVREKTLEAQVGNMTQFDRGAHTHSPSAGIYFQDAIPDSVPLLLCIGSPCGTSASISHYLALGDSQSATFPTDSSTDFYYGDESWDNELSVYDVHEQSPDGEADPDVTDEEQWEEENSCDPYDSARLQAERERADADPLYLSQLYWQARVSTRKYRAAKGTFGPKRRFGDRKPFAKRFARRGPTKARGKGKGRKSSGSGGSKGFPLRSTSYRWNTFPIP